MFALLPITLLVRTLSTFTTTTAASSTHSIDPALFAPEPSIKPDPNAVGIFTGRGVYLCSKPRWSGNCKWNEVEYSDYRKCLTMINKGGIVGIGIDTGTWIGLFSDDKCMKKIEVVKYPGGDDFKGYIDHKTETIWVQMHDETQDSIQDF